MMGQPSSIYHIQSEQWVLPGKEMTSLELKYFCVFPFKVKTVKWCTAKEMARLKDSEVTPINIGMCYYCKYMLAWKFTVVPVRTGAPGIESVYLDFTELVTLTALYLKI